MVWDWNGLLGPRDLPPLDLLRYQQCFAFPVRDYYLHLGFDFEAGHLPAPEYLAELSKTLEC